MHEFKKGRKQFETHYGLKLANEVDCTNNNSKDS
jgi:hypothetical protein